MASAGPFTKEQPTGEPAFISLVAAVWSTRALLQGELEPEQAETRMIQKSALRVNWKGALVWAPPSR
jgi:hypothetical protein